MVTQLLAQSCAEFLVHGVDVEGKRLGIDEELVALLGQHSPIPVTYAGGASTMVSTWGSQYKHHTANMLLCLPGLARMPDAR